MNNHSSVYNLEHTLYAKGIAILLLLFHHLFFLESETGLFYGNINITQNAAQLAKLCVSMFLILSGIGLSETIKARVGVKQFFVKRLGNIYLNYWLIWLFFVPVGIVFNYLNLTDIYQSSVGVELVVNLLAMQILFETGSLAGSWWFVTLILQLYLIFPIFRILLTKYGIAFVMFSLGLKFILFMEVPFNLGILLSYVFPFVFGMYLSHIRFFDGFYAKKPANKLWIYGLVFFIFCLLFILKHKFHIESKGLIYNVSGFGVILICFDTFHMLPKLSKCIMIFGSYSFSMYLFHEFLQNYYMDNFMHSYPSAAIRYIVMVVSCLALAWLIEKIKKPMGFNFLLSKLRTARFEDRLFIR